MHNPRAEIPLFDYVVDGGWSCCRLSYKNGSSPLIKPALLTVSCFKSATAQPNPPSAPGESGLASLPGEEFKKANIVHRHFEIFSERKSRF